MNFDNADYMQIFAGENKRSDILGAITVPWVRRLHENMNALYPNAVNLAKQKGDENVKLQTIYSILLLSNALNTFKGRRLINRKPAWRKTHAESKFHSP